jgi:hypothetical protein
MAQNLQIDPEKKDYEVKNGAPIATDRVFESVYIALLIPQGRWIYGLPDQGSLIDSLERSKHDSAFEQKFAAYAQSAIKSQVIGTGKATASQVKNLSTSRTSSVNAIGVVPAVLASPQFSLVPV